MPRKDDAILKVSGRGLNKFQKMTDTNQKYVRGVIQDMIFETGLTAQSILQNNAPKRTGRLRESIVITGQNRSTSHPSPFRRRRSA